MPSFGPSTRSCSGPPPRHRSAAVFARRTALTPARLWAGETPVPERRVPAVCHLPYQTRDRCLPWPCILTVSSVIQMTDAAMRGHVESLTSLCQSALRPSPTSGVLDTEGHDVPVHRGRTVGAEPAAG